MVQHLACKLHSFNTHTYKIYGQDYIGRDGGEFQNSFSQIYYCGIKLLALLRLLLRVVWPVAVAINH